MKRSRSCRFRICPKTGQMVEKCMWCGGPFGLRFPYEPGKRPDCPKRPQDADGEGLCDAIGARIQLDIDRAVAATPN